MFPGWTFRFYGETIHELRSVKAKRGRIAYFCIPDPPQAVPQFPMQSGLHRVV